MQPSKMGVRRWSREEFYVNGARLFYKALQYHAYRALHRRVGTEAPMDHKKF
jgi:hypothetical protein